MLFPIYNNGFDDRPTWENATESVLNNYVYQFTNTTKTSTQWGVVIRVTVTRGKDEGRCYVTEIGGAFE